MLWFWAGMGWYKGGWMGGWGGLLICISPNARPLVEAQSCCSCLTCGSSLACAAQLEWCCHVLPVSYGLSCPHWQRNTAATSGDQSDASYHFRSESPIKPGRGHDPCTHLQKEEHGSLLEGVSMGTIHNGSKSLSGVRPPCPSSIHPHSQGGLGAPTPSTDEMSFQLAKARGMEWKFESTGLCRLKSHHVKWRIS